MAYKIIFKNEKVFNEDISKISKKDLIKIFEKIDILSLEGVQNSQVKKLMNYKISDYRFRIGNFRVLFNFFPEKNEIIIIRVLHRSKLY